MSASSCPDREALARLLAGRVTAPLADELELHLLECDRCAQLADSLTAGDELTMAMRQARRTLDEPEMVSRVIARGKDLWSKMETVRREETVEMDAERNRRRSAIAVDFLEPARREDEIGRLGEYRVLEVLGVGGMGIVFRAEDPRLGRQVAVKAIRPEVAASRAARERLMREARATAAIEHDHIVTIHHVGEQSGVPYLVMPLLRGESLSTRLARDGRLSERDVLRIGRQAAAGLAAAHDHGLVHRDIKPDNIWLEEGTGRVKILDFGLVWYGQGDSELTQAGMVIGTPKYMAPEQSRGEPVDHRTDLFSLGVMLYRMAAGTSPFESKSTTATMRAVAEREPSPLDRIRPDVRPELAKLIGRLLEKDPNERPDSAGDVARLLAAMEQDADTTQPWERAAESAAVPETRVRGRRGWFAAALGLAAALVPLVLWQAGVIFNVRTAQGTIRISFDAAATPVEIDVSDDGVVTVKDPNDGRPITLTIDRDARRLVFNKQGFRLAVRSFELPVRNGGAIHVEFVPLEDAGQAAEAAGAVAEEGVLTVAQDGSGQFTTIAAAFAMVRRGMTIRVLDDGVYDDALHFSVPDAHADVTLEATHRATLKSIRQGNVLMVTVPGVRIRGFRFEAEDVMTIYCAIGFRCAGTIVEDVQFTALPNQLTQGVAVEAAMIAEGEPPVIVRNCRFDGSYFGVRLRGVATDYVTAEPNQAVMIVDNRFHDCYGAIDAEGDLRRILIAGNQITQARLFGIQLEHLMGGSRDIVVANNTLFQSRWPFRYWDEEVRGLNVTIANNLTLGCQQPDWVFLDSGGDRDTPQGPGDGELLKRTWNITHNWREGEQPARGDLLGDAWISPGDRNVWRDEIAVQSRDPADPAFLRPAADSPLARGGAGDTAPTLPGYVGALPADPDATWDWMATWRSMVDGP